MALSEANDVITVRLQSIAYAARDVLLFEFSAMDGGLPPVSAGAHIDVHLSGGLQRQYSLVTPLCGPRSYVVAVKREHSGRGGSRWLHDEARVGATLRISPPRNNFGLVDSADPVLLLAGGIGITPIFSMFARLQAQGRNVRLHYWSRSAEHALFHAKLSGHPDVSLYDTSCPGRPDAADVMAVAAAGTEIYCCGPTRMIEACRARIPDGSRLHVEHFTPVASAPDAERAGFTVHLSRIGLDVTVAADQSVLQALLAAGIDMPYSCEEGICGACETRLIDGDPIHCDSVRSADDHTRLGTFMICCSRSNGSRLVLEV